MHQKTMEVSKNQVVILVCKASGLPIPTVNLQRINILYEWESLFNQPYINKSESLWWYELKEYSDRDAYRCLANNTVDEFATSEVVVLSVIGQRIHYYITIIFFNNFPLVYHLCVACIPLLTEMFVTQINRLFQVLAKCQFHVR